jgi:acyl CoA:acetate/3-ketoacid CoA transferase beta subunit
VDLVVTDLAVLRWDRGAVSLQDVAPGFGAREVLELSEIEATIRKEAEAWAR